MYAIRKQSTREEINKSDDNIKIGAQNKKKNSNQGKYYILHFNFEFINYSRAVIIYLVAKSNKKIFLISQVTFYDEVFVFIITASLVNFCIAFSTFLKYNRRMLRKLSD